MPLSLAAGDLQIWYRCTGLHDERVVQADVSILSPEERARCERFVFPRDRRDFAAAHSLLRRVLSTYEAVEPQAWRFAAAAHGKPFLPAAAAAPAFNLSHTHGLVACAVARDAAVGIDVETIDRAADGRSIAGRFFSRPELALLDACAADERAGRFIELWTLKESYLKAIGQGLAHPLNTFDFAFDGAGGLRFNAPPDAVAEEWTFALFAPSPLHRLAVAVRFDRATPRHIVARGEDGRTLTPLRRTADLTGRDEPIR